MKSELLTAFTEEIISNAAKRFGLDTEKIKSLDGFENYVCESTRSGRPYVLRISHSARRSADQVRAELDWVNYLAEHGASVCVPMRSNDGSLVETFESGEQTLCAVVFEKAEGRYIKRDNQTPAMTRNRGRLLGKIHALSKAYVSGEGRPQRFHWYQEEDFADFEKFLGPGDSGVARKFHELITRLRSFPTDRESYGLIHFDAHTGNMLFEGNRPTLFDFDDCAYDFFMADIAIPLFYAVLFLPDKWKPIEYARGFLNEMFEGYSEHNSLDRRWLELIPLILKRREMILYVAIHRGFDTDNLNDWCRRYMSGRKERIEEDVPVLDMDFSEFG